jgi:hypothetical protein
METTFTIPYEHILDTGIYKGFNCTPEVMKRIIENFNKLNIKPPVKLGHGNQDILNRSGYPAAGYITDLKISDDNKLYGTISNIPKKIKDIIDTKAYIQKSVEIIPNYKDNDNIEHGPALVGLALLGEDIPEVKTLDDIRNLYFSEQLTLSAENSKNIITLNKEADMPEDVKPVVSEVKPEEVKQEIIAEIKPTEPVISKESIDEIASSLEAVIEKLYAVLENADNMEEMMAMKLEKATDKVASLLKDKKKKKKEMAENIYPEEKPVIDEAVKTEMSAMKEQITNLSKQLIKEQQLRKDAEIEKLNFSDNIYLEKLVETGKITPAMRDTLKPLLLSINKTESNIIKLDDKTNVVIKDVIKSFIDNIPAQVDLSTQTINSKESEIKKPEEVHIDKMKEQFPQYFKK